MYDETQQSHVDLELACHAGNPNMNIQQTFTESSNSSKLQAEADTRLHGRWLLLARVTWFILVALALAVFVASLPVYIAQLQSVCKGTACATGQLTPQIIEMLRNLSLSLESYAAISIALALVQVLVWFTVGGVLFWRRSNDWMALMVALMLVLLGTSTTLTTVAGSHSAWQFPAQFLDFFAYIILIFVILLFPNGRFVPRWTWLLMIVIIPEVGFYNFFRYLALNNDIWFILLLNLIWIGFVMSIMVTQIYRYIQISNLVQRQQTKWVIFAITIVLMVEVVFTTPSLFFHSLTQADSLYWLVTNTISSFVLLLFPLSFGISILRYRLWDIDIIINRTLVYGILTGILALVYFVSIFFLQFLLRGVTGTSGLAIVGSTLAIAALFQPLRKRIQTIIDRRFYRRKYDVGRTLAAFNSTLRNEVDLDQLREHLVAVVQETMEPAHVSLWLRTHNRRQESDEQARI
jgi:hypothetical protein